MAISTTSLHWTTELIADLEDAFNLAIAPFVALASLSAPDLGKLYYSDCEVDRLDEYRPDALRVFLVTANSRAYVEKGHLALGSFCLLILVEDGSAIRTADA